MNKKLLIIVGVLVLLFAGLAGAGFWWLQQSAGGGRVEQAPEVDAKQPSYVTLDKIVVMLRTNSSRSGNYYLSLDLVFRTDKKHEKAVKADLPMLKGVAVRTLTQVDVEQAKAMSIDEWTEVLGRDLMAAYEGRMAMRGFDQVMVTRLIIE